MNITLDQALAYDTIATLGTVQKAAEALNKGHSAVLYLIRSLEEQTQIQLFDRSGYRNRVTVEGQVVLKYCRRLIATRKELELVCLRLRNNWEPSLKLIYDGVVDFNIIGDALYKLNETQVPTEVKVLAAYLHEVEATFEAEAADMMVTILPIRQPNISSIELKPIRMLLVAHQDHALAQPRRGEILHSDFSKHTFIKIRGAKNILGLGTEHLTGGLTGQLTENLDLSSSFSVNDFSTKKQALLKRLGYGWMPEYLIESELKKKTLRVLKTGDRMPHQHFLSPRLYHRHEDALGKTAQQLIKYFRS